MPDDKDFMKDLERGDGPDKAQPPAKASKAEPKPPEEQPPDPRPPVQPIEKVVPPGKAEPPPTTTDEDEQPDIQDVPADEPPDPGPGYITLRMPRSVPYEEGFEFPEGNLNFGPAPKHSGTPDANIKFHAEGPGDGFAVVREDHPLLDDLMRRYPQVELVESSTRPEAYVCEVCEKEYKTRRGLLNHKRSHG